MLLTEWTFFNIVPPMTARNAIFGICREIIR